jgi:hypothetical protein
MMRGAKLLATVHKTPRHRVQNYFQAFEINFRATKIYFQGFEIYFRTTENVLCHGAKKK